MAYIKPQVRVFQEFTTSPSIGDNIRRAHISGPNALLHRFSKAAEKPLIGLGSYVNDTDTAYFWPAKQGGSLVDLDSVKLFVENGLLKYFEDLIGETSGDLGTITPVSGRANYITHDTVNWRTANSYSRSSLLLDRDVKIGDVAYIRGIEDPEGDCIEHTLWTTVAGFSANTVAAVVGSAYSDAANAEDSSYDIDSTFTAGQANCVLVANIDGESYDGLPSGNISETYTIEVIKSAVAGCQAARFRVTSASGNDDVSEVTPADFGDATTIGTRGLTVTFDLSEGGGCGDDAIAAGLPADQFIVGQTWEVSITQQGYAACATANNTYTGSFDDTYIITVVKGGKWADGPKISVRTARGLDSSGPTSVTGNAVSVPVGSYGLTASFAKCSGGGGSLSGLRYGDIFYIDVVSSSSGPVRTLILRDNLPSGLLAADDLDLKLYIQKTFEINPHRTESAPLTNYDTSASTITVNSGITAYDSTWTLNGEEQVLTLESGCTLANSRLCGQLFAEYREFVDDLTNDIRIAVTAADLDDIPGPLEPSNPLKWGVYKALINTSSSGVAYTAVADPSDPDSWQTVLDAAEGRPDIYNFVPLTFDTTVQNLFVAQAVNESAPEVGNWKGVILSGQYKETAKVVGGDDVLATIAENIGTTETDYTLMTISNATLLTDDVRSGDSVRFLYDTDGYGGEIYTTYVVQSVLSETSLILVAGPDVAVSVPQKVEIWHTLTKSEIATDLVEQAQSFANRRVVFTAPDIVYEAGLPTPGYFVCCAVGGLISSVQPHQGLTHVQLSGLGGIVQRTRDYFKASLLDQLSAGGVWTVTADRAGTIFTRHAVTTDTTDLKNREEMIRRNADSISYDFVELLKPYIGRTNATPTVLTKLDYEINKKLDSYTSVIVSQDLGPQLISGAIAVDSTGAKLLRIHPLAADRIEIVLNVSLPAPGNNIDLHIVA